MGLNFTPTVKTRMKTLKMKPVELARKTGYSAQYISELLSGRKRWNETTMNKVCSALNMRAFFVDADSADTNKTMRTCNYCSNPDCPYKDVPAEGKRSWLRKQVIAGMPCWQPFPENIGRKCPRCGGEWYSADTGSWRCEYCGAELDDRHDKPLNLGRVDYGQDASSGELQHRRGCAARHGHRGRKAR